MSLRSKHRPTITQVAKISGVAPSTVSHILSGRKGCYASAATRQRVTEVARTLGYRPNLAARALRGGATATVGLITTAIDIEAVSAKCKAFEEAARRDGYLTIMTFNPNDPAIEDRLIQWMRDRCVDGLVIHPVESGGNAQLRALAAERFPLVTLNSAGRLNFDTHDVSVDYFAGGKMQAQHLLELNRTDVCLVTHGTDYYTIARRVAGLTDTLRRAGRGQVRTLLLPADVTRFNRADSEDYAAMRRHFQEHRGAFNAVVGTNDDLAAMALRALLDLGLKVPDDVAVIGFDDSTLARHGLLPMTTVAQPALKVGIESFDLVQRLMRHETFDATQRVLLQPQLMVRASTVGRG